MKKVVGLVKSRHVIEKVNSYVFEEDIKDVTDIQALNEVVHSKLHDATEITLYVTGLTVALVAVINYALANNLVLTLMHFNRESGEYFPQVVLSDIHAEVLREGGYL